MSTPIVIAKKTTDTTQDIVLHSQFANRHGLIAGATGTGKTVTLKVLAESFSRLGVPVFLAERLDGQGSHCLILGNRRRGLVGRGRGV